VIASSPADVQPVFEAIATSANRLIGGFSTAVLRFIGDELHLAAFTRTNPAADDTLKASFPRPIAEFPPFMLVRDGQTVELADTEAEDVPQLNRDMARLRGYRSMLFTPLMSCGAPIGLISVTRKQPGTFAAHDVHLLRTFADQAVIALENARLFDELRERQAELRVTFDNMGDGVIMFDAMARLVAWNRNFEEMLDLPSSFLEERPTYAEYFRYLVNRGEYASTDLEAQLSRTIFASGARSPGADREARLARPAHRGHSA
jgi:GAF domain-containing protein